MAGGGQPAPVARLEQVGQQYRADQAGGMGRPTGQHSSGLQRQRGAEERPGPAAAAHAGRKYNAL
eukprot:5968484-Lingulodinium_polyedra.AAC.1